VAFFSDNIDDILFENRNKTYGAFEMRRKYNKQFIISALVSVLVFVLIFLIPFIIINRPEKALKESPYYTEFISSQPVDIVPPEDELLPELIKLQKKAAYTVPQVVTNADEKALSDLNSDTEEADTTLKGNNPDGSTHGVLDGEGADDDAIYTYVQEPPVFPGGDMARKSFIQHNIVYPQLAKQNKIQGIVYVSFIVEKNGTLTNAKIMQGIGAGCDDEALRVVKLMPKWKPGKRQGHEVRVQIVMPLNFILQTRG
jgi:periplasmic protein TonB